MTMELPPQIKPYVDKVDAFMAKYPSATQYGRYSCSGLSESFFVRLLCAVEPWKATTDEILASVRTQRSCDAPTMLS